MPHFLRGNNLIYSAGSNGTANQSRPPMVSVPLSSIVSKITAASTPRNLYQGVNGARAVYMPTSSPRILPVRYSGAGGTSATYSHVPPGLTASPQATAPLQPGLNLRGSNIATARAVYGTAHQVK